MFNSSDDEDQQEMNAAMQQMDKELKDKEAIKKAEQQSKQDELDESSKLKFEMGDFVLQAETKVEDNYYFLKPPLGVGLFGTVFKARHKKSDQIRAVKKIRKDH
jgi:calcium-dependent protein kinase